MRICYLSTFYPWRGGIAQFNASLLRALKREHEVTAVTFTRQYPDFLFPGETQLVADGDNADRIESVRALDSINPVSWITTANRIRERRPDLLIMKFWMSFFGPSLGTVAKLVRPHAKVVTVLDNVIPHERRFFDMPATKYFLRQNHGFVAMSGSVERDLVSLTSPDVRRIRMFHPLYSHFGTPVDRAEARRRLGIAPGDRVLLFFGFIRKYKGLDLLIRAMDFLDDSCVLLIAGESYGPFDEYAELIGKSKLRERIRPLVGYIPDGKVAELFCAADVCVLPYRSATQSGITSIAYHFETPLVATDVGGLKEEIGERGTGIVVDRAEPGTIAAGIRKFFASNARDRFVAAIREVKRTGTWEAFASRLMEFSRSL